MWPLGQLFIGGFQHRLFLETFSYITFLFRCKADPLTNAERQARYKARRATAKKNGEYQLNTWLESDAHFALGRLASYRGLTKKALLEQLLVEADQSVQDSLNDKQHSAYLALNLQV